LTEKVIEEFDCVVFKTVPVLRLTASTEGRSKTEARLRKTNIPAKTHKSFFFDCSF